MVGGALSRKDRGAPPSFEQLRRFVRIVPRVAAVKHRRGGAVRARTLSMDSRCTGKRPRSSSNVRGRRNFATRALSSLLACLSGLLDEPQPAGTVGKSFVALCTAIRDDCRLESAEKR